MKIENQKKIVSDVKELLKGLKPEDKVAAAIIIAAEIQKEALVTVTKQSVAKMINDAKADIDEKVDSVKNIEKTVIENSKNTFIIQEALTQLKNNKQ